MLRGPYAGGLDMRETNTSFRNYNKKSTLKQGVSGREWWLRRLGRQTPWWTLEATLRSEDEHFYPESKEKTPEDLIRGEWHLQN